MKYVPKAITVAAGHTVLSLKKNSPTLLFVAGVVGTVGATVLACRATLKAQTVVENAKKDLIDVDVLQNRKQVDEEAARKTRAQIMTTGALELSKLYGPSVAVGVVSIICLTKSHRLLTQRNAALTTAYVGLQNFLEGYRSRVRQEIGEEREQDVYYSATPIELIEDTEDGPKKLYGSRPTQASPYAVIWDETSGVFQDADEYNHHYIRIKEQMFTDKLRAQGYLFLNDIYEAFDIPVTATGQVCGWIIPSDKSDDFVEIKSIRMRDFQRSLMLDFNVAGVVYQMLDDVKMSR